MMHAPLHTTIGKFYTSFKIIDFMPLQDIPNTTSFGERNIFAASIATNSSSHEIRIEQSAGES
jgi:hypothetical protein